MLPRYPLWLSDEFRQRVASVCAWRRGCPLYGDTSSAIWHLWANKVTRRSLSFLIKRTLIQIEERIPFVVFILGFCSVARRFKLFTVDSFANYRTAKLAALVFFLFSFVCVFVFPTKVRAFVKSERYLDLRFNVFFFFSEIKWYQHCLRFMVTCSESVTRFPGLAKISCLQEPSLRPKMASPLSHAHCRFYWKKSTWNISVKVTSMALRTYMLVQPLMSSLCIVSDTSLEARERNQTRESKD